MKENPPSALQPDGRTTRADDVSTSRRRSLMLALATLGFAVNFWAWALLSPLGPRFKDALHLSSFQQALLVAVPVVVGSHPLSETVSIVAIVVAAIMAWGLYRESKR